MIVIDTLAERGEIGGRTVCVLEDGSVECRKIPVASLADGAVRVRSVRTAISPGTELTYVGRSASNVYLHKSWDPVLRVFTAGEPATEYPVLLGYRASGEVVESRDGRVAPGDRVFGKWRHTELTTLTGDDAIASRLPEELTHDDGVDLAHMLPICINAVAHAEGEHVARDVVVFGAGVVGLLVAQVARAEGAARVQVVEMLASRRAVAAELGFDVLDARDDVAVALKRTHGSDAIAVAFECSGSTRALHEAIRVVRRRGAVVAVGFYQGEARGLFLGDEFHHNGVVIRSGQIGNVHPSLSPAALRARALDLARTGRVRPGRMPRVCLPVERAPDGYALAARPDAALQVAFAYSEEANRLSSGR